MSNSKQSHPYHLVEPSPWPLLGSISALILAVGAIMFMHKINFGEWVFWYGRFSSNTYYVWMVERRY